MVDIQAGQELRVPVGVKNIGGTSGTFTLRGQIVYKNGAPAGTMYKQGTTSEHEARTIAGGTVYTFLMAKPNWAAGKIDGFGHLEALDIVWTVTVSQTGQVLSEIDVDAVRHVWGPVAQFVQPRVYTVV